MQTHSERSSSSHPARTSPASAPPFAVSRRRSSLSRSHPLALAAALALASLLLACDTIDIEAVSSAKDAAEEKLFAAVQGAKGENGNEGAGAEPTMDSIGPDSAKRVYYQFLDDRGGVQFVERLDAVPAAWRDRVGYVEMDQPPPLTPAAARASWKISESRKVELASANSRRTHTSAGGKGKRRMDDFQDGKVLLYSATWCGYCTKARRHLDRKGVEYELLDVDNGSIASELKRKTGRGGIPVLDFEGEILRGYSASEYDALIKSIKG